MNVSGYQDRLRLVPSDKACILPPKRLAPTGLCRTSPNQISSPFPKQSQLLKASRSPSVRP